VAGTDTFYMMVMALLRQWNSRHWIRSIFSGVSFICYLVALESV